MDLRKEQLANEIIASKSFLTEEEEELCSEVIWERARLIRESKHNGPGIEDIDSGDEEDSEFEAFLRRLAAKNSRTGNAHGEAC